MRIGLLVENLLLGKYGGVEVYARNLVRYLQAVDNRNEYLIFCTNLNEEAFPITNDNFKKIVKIRNKFRDRLLFYTAKLFEFMEERAVLRDVKKAAKKMVMGTLEMLRSSSQKGEAVKPDLIHYMFTVFPYWIEQPAPVVLTVHDIQQEYYPEFFSEEVLKSRSRTYRPSAEKADHIISVSAFTKKTLVEKYNIPPEKISVVLEGYDRDKFNRLDDEEVAEFRHRLGLPKNFILYPAATWAHKNHINLIRAYKILREKFGVRDVLVLSGIKKENHDAVVEEIERHGLDKYVMHLGYLPYEELPLLFNAAGLMVFPSLFEGFGIPVVEAMAVGLPVVCSNVTSLPEVAGDAAIYFDPKDPEDIAEKVFKVYSDQGLREALIQKGFERAKRFTWERTAEETLKVYEKVYKSTGKGLYAGFAEGS